MTSADEEDTTTTTTTATTTTTKKSGGSASLARARAQARRRRILEQGKDRMNYVNGVAEAAVPSASSDLSQPEKPKKNEDVVPSSVEEEGEEGIGGGGGGGGGGDTAAPTTPAPTTPAEDAADTDAASPQPALTGAQRLAQARRRRYRKSTTTATTSTDTTTSTTDDTTAATAATAADDHGTSVSTNTPDDTETTTDTSTEPTTTTTTTTTTTEPKKKKKYLGVAKVRRKLIAEKKASESHLLHNTTNSSTTSSMKPPSTSQRRKNRQAYSGTVVPTLPVFFQLLTVLTLFFVGFDAGLYNHYTGSYQTIDGTSSPKVIATIGAMDNGYGLLSTLGLYHRSSSIDSTIMGTQDDTVVSGEDNTELETEEEEEDEFATTTKPLGASSKTNRVPNIDPLFRVDLDEITDHPGIFMWFCRLAVRFHQSLMYLVYGLPKSFLQGIGSLFVGGGAGGGFRRPILFFLAVMVRTIGRRILGASATVPDLDETLEKRLEAETGVPGLSVSDDIDVDPTGGKKKKTGLEQLGNMDLMATGTAYVTKFFETNFPKTMAVYEMFRYAKEDMYVVLCGFFLGMVLPMGWLSAFGMNGALVGGDGDEMAREEL